MRIKILILSSFYGGVNLFAQNNLKKSFCNYEKIDTVNILIYKFFKNKFESKFNPPDTVQFGVRNNSKRLKDFNDNDYYSLTYNSKCESIFDSDQQKVFYRFNFNDTFQVSETYSDNGHLEFPVYIWELPQLPYGGILSSYKYRLLKRSKTEDIYETKNRKPFPIRISVDPNSLLINYIVHNNETFIDSMILNYAYINIQGDKKLFTISHKDLNIKSASDVLDNSLVNDMSEVVINEDSCTLMINNLLPLEKYIYVIGDFWHIHCAPCIKNMRMLEAMNLDSNFYFIGLNDIDSKEAIGNFKIKNNFTMPLISVSTEFAKCFLVHSYPTTVVYKNKLMILKIDGFIPDFEQRLLEIVD